MVPLHFISTPPCHYHSAASVCSFSLRMGSLVSSTNFPVYSHLITIDCSPENTSPTIYLAQHPGMVPDAGARPSVVVK